MLRVLDAAGAVAARGWPPHLSGAIDLALDDDVCPWNSGAWRLVLEAGEGRLEPGGSGAVRMTMRGLAVWYAGAADPAVLRRAGLLAGTTAATRSWPPRAPARGRRCRTISSVPTLDAGRVGRWSISAFAASMPSVTRSSARGRAATDDELAVLGHAVAGVGVHESIPSRSDVSAVVVGAAPDVDVVVAGAGVDLDAADVAERESEPSRRRA